MLKRIDMLLTGRGVANVSWSGGGAELTFADEIDMLQTYPFSVTTSPGL